MQILKFLELIIPLATIPVVIDKLGISSFGLFSMVLIFSQYLILIGDWGFNVNAAREFSVGSINKVRFLVLFRDIQRAKLIFLSLILFFFCFLSIFFHFDLGLAITSWLFIAVSVMQCTWFFQARYLLLQLLFVSFISKLFYVVYVFYFLDDNSTVSTYLFWFSSSMLLTSLFSNVKCYRVMRNGLSKGVIKKTCWYKNLFMPFSKTFLLLLIEGWYLVSSRIVSSLNTPTFYYLSKIFFGLEFVGFFSVVQRIVSSVISLLIPLVDVTFPYLSQLVVKEVSIKGYVGKILSLVFFVNMFFLFIAFNFRFVIFDFFKLEYKYDSFLFLMIYSFIIFLSISGTLMVNILVAKRITSRVLRCVVIGNLFGYIMFFILNSTLDSEIAIAISMILNQFVVSYLLFIASRLSRPPTMTLL